jgi:stage V sporulation protein S
MTTIKVSARSRTAAVAGAIAGVVRDNGHAEVQAIGAGAVNQAVKAVAIAINFLQQDGLDMVCVPVFVEVPLNKGDRTGVRLVVQKR